MVDVFTVNDMAIGVTSSLTKWVWASGHLALQLGFWTFSVLSLYGRFASFTAVVCRLKVVTTEGYENKIRRRMTKTGWMGYCWQIRKKRNIKVREANKCRYLSIAYSYVWHFVKDVCVCLRAWAIFFRGQCVYDCVCECVWERDSRCVCEWILSKVKKTL